MEAVLCEAPRPVGQKVVGRGGEGRGSQIASDADWRLRTLDVSAFPFNKFCYIHSLLHPTVLTFTSVVQQFISFTRRFSVVEFPVRWYHAEGNPPPRGNPLVLVDYRADLIEPPCHWGCLYRFLGIHLVGHLLFRVKAAQCDTVRLQTERSKVPSLARSHQKKNNTSSR